jgi:hypothetical protein
LTIFYDKKLLSTGESIGGLYLPVKGYFGKNINESVAFAIISHSGPLGAGGCENDKKMEPWPCGIQECGEFSVGGGKEGCHSSRKHSCGMNDMNG